MPKYKAIVQDSIEIVLVSKSFSPSDIEKVNKFKSENDITLIKYIWFEKELLLIEYLNNEPQTLQREVKRKKDELVAPQAIFYKSTEVERNETMYLNSKKKGIRATGYLNADRQFVVLAGSLVSKSIGQKSTPPGALKERLKCEKSHVIKDGVFVADHPFNSISLAAEVILGGSQNGNKVWKKK